MASNPSKAPKARTTSRGLSGRAASRKAGKSGKTQVHLPPQDFKVFAKPEFQVPFHLAMYTNGPHKKRAVQAPMWLQVAILSGLVEMVSPSAAKAGDGFLKPIRKRHPLPRMTPEKLDALMLKGMAEALPYLDPTTDPTLSIKGKK